VDEENANMTEEDARGLGQLKKKRRKDTIPVTNPLGQNPAYVGSLGVMAGGSGMRR